MKTITTKQGVKILVDDEDYLRLKAHKWSVNSRGYAVRFTEHLGVKKGIRMHREILELGEYDGGMEVDHINRNKLDNRRCNLRLVTRSENQKNRNPFYRNGKLVGGQGWGSV
jgi:hypothetical protein